MDRPESIMDPSKKKSLQLAHFQRQHLGASPTWTFPYVVRITPLPEFVVFFPIKVEIQGPKGPDEFSLVPQMDM